MIDFFQYSRDRSLIGVWMGGAYLITRADKTHPLKNSISQNLMEGMTDLERVLMRAALGVGSVRFTSDGIKKTGPSKEVLAFEQRMHGKFVELLKPDMYQFKLSDISPDIQIDSDLLMSIFDMHLKESAEIVYEFIGRGAEILRVAKKPNLFGRIFTTTKTGDTLSSVAISAITDIEFTGDKVLFLSRSECILAVDRTSCYVQRA